MIKIYPRFVLKYLIKSYHIVLNSYYIYVKSFVAKLKKKNLQDSDICCLVPELCNLTGLTDVMKSDFKLMKALQAHTLVTPEARQKAIMSFVDRINGT